MADKKYITRNELAKLAGCSPSAVSKAKQKHRVFMDEQTGLYPAQNEINISFINAGFGQRQSIQTEIVNDNTEISADMEPGDVPESLENLYRQKLQMDIEYKSAQKRKLDLQFEKDKENFLPAEFFGIFLGYFANGIKYNFLTIARKAARGDLELERRIDSLITLAIEKTRDTAKKEIEKHSKKISAHMEAIENENIK